jgi:hypothetical protein
MEQGVAWPRELETDQDRTAIRGKDAARVALMMTGRGCRPACTARARRTSTQGLHRHAIVEPIIFAVD